MSTVVFPPVPAARRRQLEAAALTRELQWLLDALQDSLAALKSGLDECAALLAPEKGATTLVLSSLRSESIKGFATREGGRVVKGDITLQLASIRPPPGQQGLRLSVSTAPTAPTIVLDQLTQARTLINASLDVIDVTKWTGDAQDAQFIAGQLRLLYDNVQEAKHMLKGGRPAQKEWFEAPIDDKAFDPPCPPSVSFHLSIAEAALILQIRTLEAADAPENPDSLTGLGLRERIAAAFGAPQVHAHEELGQRFSFKGRDVRVKEYMRVESQDPSLLSAMAKLSALEHSIAMSVQALNTVMGKDENFVAQ